MAIALSPTRKKRNISGINRRDSAGAWTNSLQMNTPQMAETIVRALPQRIRNRRPDQLRVRGHEVEGRSRAPDEPADNSPQVIGRLRGEELSHGDRGGARQRLAHEVVIQGQSAQHRADAEEKGHGVGSKCRLTRGGFHDQGIERSPSGCRKQC